LDIGLRLVINSRINGVRFLSLTFGITT